MIRMILLIGLALLCAQLGLANNEPRNTVVVPPDALADYERFLDGRDPLNIRDYSGRYSSREVVEMVLLQQALAAAEVTLPIEFVAVDSGSAMKDALRDGSAVAAGTSFWLGELTPLHEDVRISTSVISRGQFEVGFYVHPDSVVLEGQDVSSLRQISTRQWQQDWQRLTETGFDALVHWDAWPSQVESVRSGEISFLIAPFQSNEHMLLELDDRTLAPVPGIKLALQGSRHLAVSRQHANGAFFNSALQLGLLRLKEEGRTEQAYIDAGFLQPAVHDWYRIEVGNSHSDWQF
ncbi:hypothetical protein E4656_09195 [Natronospirillum operosum]|uniref:Amino acid ABC transporter substrate-binding protein n=1 Tax=Natronospirillum operosum TaxID=2759953 RepID=A0A4Z0WDK3_9GAMM|nr:hypothetical protein [Natronospirillum operosum]TGG93226.1 hypothetical protein E4656_09195 [Natronospirillum operosum]